MRISNCQLAFSLLEAGGIAHALANAGIDADSERVAAYCERVSAATGRPVRDILDLSLRELSSLRYKIEAMARVPVLDKPGDVIPGYIDTGFDQKATAGKGSRTKSRR